MGKLFGHQVKAALGSSFGGAIRAEAPVRKVVTSAILQLGDKAGAAGRAHAAESQAFLIMRDRGDVDRAAMPDTIGNHALAGAIGFRWGAQNAASVSVFFPCLRH